MEPRSGGEAHLRYQPTASLLGEGRKNHPEDVKLAEA
jgi:hypothetical protein